MQFNLIHINSDSKSSEVWVPSLSEDTDSLSFGTNVRTTKSPPISLIFFVILRLCIYPRFRRVIFFMMFCLEDIQVAAYSMILQVDQYFLKGKSLPRPGINPTTNSVFAHKLILCHCICSLVLLLNQRRLDCVLLLAN